MDSQDIEALLEATPHQDVLGVSAAAELKQALVNEKAAPELLAYQTEVVEQVESQLRHQEGVLAAVDSPDQKLLHTLYSMDAARARYLLRCYLRTRLQKIERHVSHVLDDANCARLLSPKEVEFARDYFRAQLAHLKENCLGHLPPGFGDLRHQSAASAGSKDMVDRPDLDTHVFVRVLADKQDVQVADDASEAIDFQAGDLYVVRYRFIRDLLPDKWVELYP